MLFLTFLAPGSPRSTDFKKFVGVAEALPQALLAHAQDGGDGSDHVAEKSVPRSRLASPVLCLYHGQRSKGFFHELFVPEIVDAPQVLKIKLRAISTYWLAQQGIVTSLNFLLVPACLRQWKNRKHQQKGEESANSHIFAYLLLLESRFLQLTYLYLYS